MIIQKWYVYAIQKVDCDYEGKHYNHCKVFYAVKADNQNFVGGIRPAKYPQKVDSSEWNKLNQLKIPCEITALFEPDGRYNKFVGFEYDKTDDPADIFEGLNVDV